MILSRPRRGGLVSQEKLHKRFEMFAGGRWEELLRDRQEATGVEDRRVSKTLVGELFAGRAALEPGTNDTLQQLQDPAPFLTIC